MKLHLPKQLFTALLAAITLAAPAALTLNSTAWGEEESNSESITVPVDYSVFSSLPTGVKVYQWTGASSKNGSICYGLWYEMSHNGTSWVTGNSIGSSGSSNGYTNYVNNGQYLLFDADSVDGNSSGGAIGEARFDTSAVSFAGLIVTSDSSVTSLSGELSTINSGTTTSNRSITLGRNDSTADAPTYSVIEKDFTLTNADSTNASTAFTLQGYQQWEVAKDATFSLETKSGQSISQTGNLTITGSGTVAFLSNLTNSGTLTVNSGATLTSSSAFTNAAGASVSISGALTSTGSFTNNGIVDVYGTLSTSSQGTIGTMNIKAGGVLDVTAWSDKTTFGTLNALTTLTTSSDNSGVGYIKLDVPSDNDGREVALSTASTSLNKNFWFVDNAPALHGGSAAGGRTLEIGKIDGESKYLKADAGIEAWSDATIAVSGGHLEAKHIILGHYSVGAHHYGALTMSSGSITTGAIKFNKQTGNAVTITGGSLEFTTSNALEYTSANSNSPDTSATVRIKGSSAEKPVTLKATQTAWTLDGSVLTTAPSAPTIGNVTIDGGNTKGITLKGVSLEGSITNNATAENTGLALENVTVSGSGITFSGAGVTTLSGTNTIAGAVTNDGSLTLSGTNTITEAVTNNGSLTLSGTLDFSGATLTTESALITLGTDASLTINGGTIFKFGALEAGTQYKFIGTSDGSALSDNGWEDINVDQIYINGAQLNSSGYRITTSGGVFSYSLRISSLTWNGSVGVEWSSTSPNWTTDTAASNAYVNTIDTSFTSAATATVTEAITTGNLTIGEENAQSGITVTLSAENGGSLTVAENRTLSISNNSTLNSAVGIDVSGANVSMGTEASWNLTGTAQQNLTEAQLNSVTKMDIGETASLTVDATAAAALSTINASMLRGTGTVALSMNDENNNGLTSNGLKANLSNFTGTIQLGDGAAGDTTDRYNNTEYLIYTGSGIDASATISLLNGGGLAFSKTTSTAESPEEMTNALVVSNGGSAAQTKAGSTVHVEDGVYAEISGGISGTGQLFKKGAGTLSLSGNTTVSALKVMDGTLNLGGTASLTYLGVGGGSSVTDSTILNITGTVSADQLRMGEEGYAAVNIQYDGSLTIKGTDSSNSTDRSLLLTHWGKDSTLTLDGGNLTSTGARMFLSWTGKGTFKALSGTANLLGIDFDAQDNSSPSIKGNFYLGDESNGAGSARVNIGADGIANVDNAAVVIKLGEGTLGASSDWEMAANTNNAGNVQLIGTTTGTVFNTQNPNPNPNPNDSTGHTITINASLSGSGKLVKDGLGTLTLSGANTYSGGTTIKAGTVTTQHASALGSGKVTVNAGGVLSVAQNLNLQDTLQLSGDGEVQVATGQSLNLQDKVSLSSKDGTNAATLTAKSNSALAQLQEDASFTIQDMTLTNTTITAATTTEVKLQNVTATNVVLKQGKFSTDADMGVAVGMGGSGSSLVFEGGLAASESITINASEGASLAVDLGDLSCVTEMNPGKYDLSITLSGVKLDDYTDLAVGAGITFEGWLGELISASRDVQVSFSEAVAEETPAAAAEGGAATGVTYSTGSVGTVIYITGLNVPEPATSTLSLLALAALAARRRRND